MGSWEIMNRWYSNSTGIPPKPAASEILTKNEGIKSLYSKNYHLPNISLCPDLRCEDDFWDDIPDPEEISEACQSL